MILKCNECSELFDNEFTLSQGYGLVEGGNCPINYCDGRLEKEED